MSEAHCMSFPCTEQLLFNYAKVNVQGINVCLQNHLWLCTPLPKFITSDLYAL